MVQDSTPKLKHRTFYLGTHRADWLERLDVPLFVAYQHLSDRRKLPRARTRWALDSGGYTHVLEHGGWTFDARTYAAGVRRIRDEVGRMDWAAPQDWMCEAHVLRRTGLAVHQHLVRTVSNYLELMAVAPDLPWAPVLQGWTLSDYLDCAELYDASGVDLRRAPVVGVGTMCRRESTLGAAQKLRWLASEGYRLHGFGLKKEGLRMVGDVIASADSLAWSYDARERGRKGQTCCPVGRASCVNCSHFALEWRSELLGSLGPAWQRDGLAGLTERHQRLRLAQEELVDALATHPELERDGSIRRAASPHGARALAPRAEERATARLGEPGPHRAHHDLAFAPADAAAPAGAAPPAATEHGPAVVLLARHRRRHQLGSASTSARATASRVCSPA